MEVDISPIREGDVVYCADAETHEACWVNGQVVVELFEQFPNNQTLLAREMLSPRARCKGFPEYSHQVFYLRHHGERLRTPDDVFDVFERTEAEKQR